MKLKLIMLSLLMSCLCASTAYAETRKVTLNEAYEVAQQRFQGRDVDYYYLDNNPVEFVIFVDAEPMKGWEHECYTLTVPKNISTDVDLASVTNMTRGSTPPQVKFNPLSVKNRYGANAKLKPVVRRQTLANGPSPAAQRTYAIILSGGISPMANNERYWNDCSFIYQTLVNKYGVPRANITPIMSDGRDPAEDMRCYNEDHTAPIEYMSQPLDLDNDGTDDIALAATKANVRATLRSLESRLNEDDHLFIFVIDHGGYDNNEEESYICLWEGERLYNYELASMLKTFARKNVNINVVLGQCNSGGFVDRMKKVGCVVATACTESESSYACTDMPFDEFVYQWTCAVNGATHNGVKVQADADNNGRVTMEEAFSFAKSNDRRYNEHPQYASTPLSIGEDLAFNNLAPAIDLYIKDNPEDTGKEPNMTTTDFWLSPSIWVRNQNDSIYEHENPIYTPQRNSFVVYAWVHNRGKKDYEGGTQWLHCYWAKASTDFRLETWTGCELYKNGEVSGGVMPPAAIPAIHTGDSAIVATVWALPLNYFQSTEDDPEKHHFCLLAKVSDRHTLPLYDGTFSYNLKGSNNDVQKNVSIIYDNDLKYGVNVFIRNASRSKRGYSLELIPRTTKDEAIYTYADIEVRLSRPITEAWNRGGRRASNVYQLESTSTQTFKFLSKDSRLDGVFLDSCDFDIVTLRFNFKKTPLKRQTYTLDLIQRDENGNMLGGETFIVKSPKISLAPITITQNVVDGHSVSLSVDADPNAVIRWENAEGLTIGNDANIIVGPLVKDATYYAYALNEMGEFSDASIVVPDQIGISDCSLCGDKLSVGLISPTPANGAILVSSVVSGDIIMSVDIPVGEQKCDIDLSSAKDGVYSASYILNDIVIDSRKFTK